MVRTFSFVLPWHGNFEMPGSVVGRLTCAHATTSQLEGISLESLLTDDLLYSVPEHTPQKPT